MLKPKSPIDVQIICHSWDSVAQADALDTTITVRLFLNVGNSTGRAFDYECSDPMQLWHFLRQLTDNPYAMLKEHFNYDPPTSKPTRHSSIPTDLNDLFKTD